MSTIINMELTVSSDSCIEEEREDNQVEKKSIMYEKFTYLIWLDKVRNWFWSNHACSLDGTSTPELCAEGVRSPGLLSLALDECPAANYSLLSFSPTLWPARYARKWCRWCAHPSDVLHLSVPLQFSHLSPCQH